MRSKENIKYIKQTIKAKYVLGLQLQIIYAVFKFGHFQLKIKNEKNHSVVKTWIHRLTLDFWRLARIAYTFRQ